MEVVYVINNAPTPHIAPASLAIPYHNERAVEVKDGDFSAWDAVGARAHPALA